MMARFGSMYCYVEGTPEEVFQHRLGHEQYCHGALEELVPVIPRPLRCRLGLHSMRTWITTDGGFCTVRWGYCTRCNGAFTEGWVESINTFKPRPTPEAQGEVTEE